MPSPLSAARSRTLPALLLSLMALAPVVTPLAASAQAPGGGAPAMPVTVVTLSAEDVTLSSPLPGRVAASALAEVRPQVGGIIQERLFEEGTPVIQGDPLYTIDPASYEAAKAAAEASLAQAKAALKSAEIEFERQEALKARNVVAQQNLDSAIADRDSAAAAVKVAEANLLAANIDLDRTTIRAPLAGVTALSEVSQGALVTSGQATALTTIRALDPIYVDVTQSAAEMLRWRRAGDGSEFAEQLGQSVSLSLADGSSYEFKGELAAAEPYVNEQTGTIVLRLSFPNPDHFLLPGMYVQVEMPQGVVAGAIKVPQEAVSRDRRGRPMALVVNAENVVEQRVLDVVSDQGTSWVVTGGVAAGERVIVAGLQKTAPGATVVPQERGAEAAAPATAPAAPSE
ncbi:efflux RND transporter periplasmic adaptor subunit [Celeribacter neptunius]|uniref:Membrane fusion protein, multidrug efflux system n=1 Tax=Celeribacter neptunius TaxID=588602 RepID=A0A1I3NCM4_9RHOB|nr:efflux RND transporter periplasmic adaptor subunit [Celeribacter neptunius]SFJ06969.1 membrane fusion protein, multidrug efflux system [Celeribacter neptunius]